jgi:hypothetical protein
MSGLSQCLCGERVEPDDVGSIRCQRTGCETIWVSDCVDFVGSRLTLNRLSIILGALAMRMQARDIGLARHVHSQRRCGDVSFS